MGCWRFRAASLRAERLRGRVRTAAAGRVEFAIQNVRRPRDTPRLEAAHLLHRQRLPRSRAPVEPVEVRADQRVDPAVILNNREGAGVGEHVAGNLRPVDDPSHVAGELVEHDVLTARVHVTERMDRQASTFRSDATSRGFVCFRASVVPRSRPFASVAVERGSPISWGGAQPHSSGLFPVCVIRVVSHVINHSVALDAIMMG